MAQRLKHPHATQETWVQSLGWEDPLEKEMATHSSILAWRVPRMEEPGGLQSTGLQRVRHNWVTSFSLYFKLKETIKQKVYFNDVTEHNLLQWNCTRKKQGNQAWSGRQIIRVPEQHSKKIWHVLLNNKPKCGTTIPWNTVQHEK